MKSIKRVLPCSTAVAALLLLPGCGRRMILYKTPVRSDIANINMGIQQYRFKNDGRLPPTLGAVSVTPESFVDKGVPVIPGSNPQSSYRYVPCPADAPPSTVILYPNMRGAGAPLYLLRLDGTIDTPTPEEYEREIRKLGQDYESLPEMMK